MIFVLVISIFLVLCMIGLGIVCIRKGMKGKNARRLIGYQYYSFIRVADCCKPLF